LVFQAVGSPFPPALFRPMTFFYLDRLLRNHQMRVGDAMAWASMGLKDGMMNDLDLQKLVVLDKGFRSLLKRRMGFFYL
jgi:hypothetical protein